MVFGCYDNINKPKRYIQFNDLVFSGRKSIDEQSESISLREFKTARTFWHGSYVGNRGDISLIDSNSISLTIALPTTHWNDEHVKAHYGFIMKQLMTPGKLWAINSGHNLVWCNAFVTSIQPSKQWTVTDDNYLVFRVEFDNPDGLWYNADENKTFLVDYSDCDFLEMKAGCLGKTRLCCNENPVCRCNCECCDNDCDALEDALTICDLNAQVYNDFYEECNSKWRVVYNCEKSLNDGKSIEDLYMHTLCDLCVNKILAGDFISTTDIPTPKWSIAIMGYFKDPIIRLNDVDLKIKGDYDGVLSIDYTGTIHYASSWECMEYNYDVVPLDDLVICAELPEVKDGLNTLSVYGVESESACLYISYESIGF